MEGIFCPYCGCEAREKSYVRPCYIHIKPMTLRDRSRFHWQNKKRKKRIGTLRILIWTHIEKAIICKACKKREKAESAKRSDIAAWKAYMEANPRYFKSLFHTPIQRAAADVFGLHK